MKPPASVAYLLIWYADLRGSNPRGWHYEPLSYSEIDAYSRMFRLRIDPFEILALRQLDQVWMKAQPEPEKPTNRGGRR